MVCRSEERGEAAVAKIQEASGNKDVHLKVPASFRPFSLSLNETTAGDFQLVESTA